MAVTETPNEYSQRILEWAEAQYEDDPSKTVLEWIDWLKEQLIGVADPYKVFGRI